MKPEVYCAEFVPLFGLLYSVNLGRFEGGILEFRRALWRGLMHYLYTPSSQGTNVGECEV